MHLYSIPFSPYAARCRIQIHHKGLPVQIVPPPGGLRSAELKAKNPTGKIPVLDLGDRRLAESWSIMEYLESRFPAPVPMLPADEFARARVRELVRYADLYLALSVVPMFRALRGAATPDEVAAALAQQDEQLAIVDALLARKKDFGIEPLDLADAALVPLVYYSIVLTRHFGKREALAGRAALTAWWTRVKAVPAAATVLGEIEAGLRQAIPVLVAEPMPA